LGTIGGQTIYDDELLPAVQGQLFPLRNQEYEIKKRALDSLIDQKLLQAADLGAPHDLDFSVAILLLLGLFTYTPPCL
jgi:hypothetical protein